MACADHIARDVFLTLCATKAEAIDPSALGSLNASQWEWIIKRARDYRMLPLLYWVLRHAPDGFIPKSVSEIAAQDYRAKVFKALMMQQALIEIGATLDKEGIAYTALKGASLSLEFYPEPALRPMRDLDILVAPKEAERAYDALKRAGYARLPGKEDYGMEHAHHLPILISPNNVLVELHHRIAPREWAGSLALAERLLANAREVEFQGHTVRMAHPSDTLLHLTVHACWQHLFDNGPNLLSDLQRLSDTGLLDWEEIHSFANSYGLKQSLALMSALYARYSGVELAPTGKQSVLDIPDAFVERAADLMTQDPEQHWQRFLLRRRRSFWQRFSEGMGRAFAPTQKDLIETAGKDVKGLNALRYYPKWLWSKGRVYVSAEFRKDIDHEAASDTQLEVWLERPAFANDA